MNYSMMSYTMARQPGFDVRAMLDLTVELGLVGIDFVTLHGHTAQELKRMTDDMGIAVVCHTFFADVGNPDRSARAAALDFCRKSVEDARTLGAPIVMIPTLERAGYDSAAARREWIAGLRHAAAIAHDAGVILTVENFPGAASPFVIASELLEAIREIPSLRLTYDNGNAATGEDPAASFTACAPYVVHAHFKDWNISDTPREGFRLMRDGRYYQPALVGEGCVPHAACLRAMHAAGYTGCINIEYEGDVYPAADAIRNAVAYLRSLEAALVDAQPVV